MPRRGDPERLYHAQRAGLFMRLVTAERIDQLDAERWISRECQAELTGIVLGSQGYWDAAWRWIAENHRKH